MKINTQHNLTTIRSLMKQVFIVVLTATLSMGCFSDESDDDALYPVEVNLEYKNIIAGFPPSIDPGSLGGNDTERIVVLGFSKNPIEIIAGAEAGKELFEINKYMVAKAVLENFTLDSSGNAGSVMIYSSAQSLYLVAFYDIDGNATQHSIPSETDPCGVYGTVTIIPPSMTIAPVEFAGDPSATTTVTITVLANITWENIDTYVH